MWVFCYHILSKNLKILCFCHVHKHFNIALIYFKWLYTANQFVMNTILEIKELKGRLEGLSNAYHNQEHMSYWEYEKLSSELNRRVEELEVLQNEVCQSCGLPADFCKCLHFNQC